MHPTILAEMADGRREQLIHEAEHAHRVSDAAARRHATARPASRDSARDGVRAVIGVLLVRTGRKLAGSEAAEAALCR
ncbi:MAG TPA: hypothetical protein VNC78_08050 [Actinomycetota bacterium]|nr:hypothetical protein [Actinomycetota bacterium]